MKQQAKEDALVERIARRLGSGKNRTLALGLGDDAALWTPRRGREVILTCDWFLEGSHFLRDKHPPEAVGWKCLARAVSDIAAMGGEPQCFLLSLALPAELTGRWLDKFLVGLKRASRTLGCEAAGGDTTKQDKVLINLTVIGEVRVGRAVLRSCAKVGDRIYVSGILGEADLGLQELRTRRGMARASSAALQKHLFPEPRLALGQWLAERRLATAMMDLSDGLSTDLPRLCAASQVGARVELNSLPTSSGARLVEAQKLALHGGDDYELLFTVSARKAPKLPEKFHGLRLTRIGTMTRNKTILLETDRGTEPLRSGGWDPFR
jgi:thiamine-monophosphate kinase